MAIGNPTENGPVEFSRGVPLDQDEGEEQTETEVVVPADPLNDLLPRGTCWQCDETVCAGMGQLTEDGRRLCVPCSNYDE